MQQQIRRSLHTALQDSALQFSWEGVAQRTMEPEEKTLWANVQHFVLRLHIVTVTVLAENASPLLNLGLLPLRCCLDGLLEGLAQLALGQVILQTASWRHSDGPQKIRQCWQLASESG